MSKMNRFLCMLSALSMTAALFSCGEEKSSEPVSSTAEETTAAAETEPVTEETTETAASDIELEGYNLLWNDEFDGDAMDETIWNYEPHEPGWTNEELQEYTTSTDNVFVKDGHLVLKAIKSEKDGKDYYTSGKVTTQNKKDFMYGKVVVSAKVPEGQGLWPAIWMMPTDESYYGQWPKCGEIDIMEILGNDTSKAYGTLHYGEPHGEQQGTYELSGDTYSDSFHEFSVEWEPGEFRWYIDGNLYHTANDWFTAVEGEEEKPYPAPFDQTFFVQLNLAVGGTWPGDPDETTDFDNAEFEVDYVRVYQKDSYDTNVSKPEKNYKEADETGNFLNNGDFSADEDLTDDQDWTFYLAEGGAGTASIHDNMIEIQTEKEGTQDYSVQIFQPNLPMIKGHKYRMSFDAYASEERPIVVCVSAPTSGWIRYLPDTELTITTEKQTYSYDFEMKDKDDNNGRAEFNLGHRGSTATVYITNVRVEEIE